MKRTRIVPAVWIMLAVGPVSCVSTQPHSIVFTPHYEHVQGSMNAFHGAENQACEKAILWFFNVGDRSIEAAMPSIQPPEGTGLAYLTINEVRKNYILWQVACTKIHTYFTRVRQPEPKMTASSANSRDMVGKNALLFVDGLSSIPVAVDTSALHAYGKAVEAKDSDARQDLLVSGKVFMVSSGTKVRVIKRNLTTSEVRIIDGPHVGKSGLVPFEWVK